MMPCFQGEVQKVEFSFGPAGNIYILAWMR